MKTLLLFLTTVIAWTSACCGLSVPWIQTGCCMQYQPPSIIGYQRIPIYKRIRVRVPVMPTYAVPPIAPPSYSAPQVQMPAMPSYADPQPSVEIPQMSYGQGAVEASPPAAPGMSPLYDNSISMPPRDDQIPVEPSGYHGRTVKLVKS
ncbi:unnamed protein product, partial [Mesorhabditis belari]|uniref:Uncharacterized protein n=1 Tax=Mesorhabditis belari TaxID=2138241 RepID=A0AAF3EGG1_9BILA